MSTKTKHQTKTTGLTLSKKSRGERLCRNSAALLSSFLLAFVFASVFTPVMPSSAVTCNADGTTENTGEICNNAGTSVTVNIENPYFISVSSSHGSAATPSPISLDYTAADAPNLGSVIAASDRVVTTTNTGREHYLYISTTSDSNSLTNSNTTSSTKTFIAPGGGDNLTSASALSDNTWGFAIPSSTSGLPANGFDNSYTSVSSSSKFTKVPALGNDILIQSENTSESTADVYYGALATTDLYADTYSNTIRYTAFSEQPPIYNITWDANGGTPSSQTTRVVDGNALDTLPTVTRPGYYFAGWFTAASNGRGITEDTVPTADTTYFAYWTEGQNMANIVYMQDLTPSICANTPTNAVTKLLDSRGYGNAGADKTTKYGVLKAEDGNCWMTDNFNLYNITIESDTSNLDSGTFDIPDTSNYAAADCDPDIGCGDIPRLHVVTNTWYDGIYTGQVHYNWCAAVALSSNCFGYVGEQKQSICPKNWKIPSAGTGLDDTTTNASWPKLVNMYRTLNGGTLTGLDFTTTDTSAVAYPLGFRAYYGYWGMPGEGGFNRGSFWSSTSYGRGATHSFRYYNSDTDIIAANGPYYYLTRNYAYSVRCVVPVD